ncbi:MAG: DUF4340 domain-containing protein [Kiritimatiellia bacterium]|nr:DUF4340 domain-containing protein [Kiritimatiellia bacterium]
MRTRPPWMLLWLVACIALFILLVDRRRQDPVTRARRAQQAFQLNADRITRIEIERDGQIIECVLEENLGWMLLRPVRTRAESSAILKLLHGLENLSKRAAVTEKEMTAHETSWADYGLASPRIRIRLEGDTTPWRLDVGHESPAGDGLYIRVADEPQVIRTETQWLASIPTDVNDWRDRQVFRAPLSDIERIELRRPEGVLRLGRGETPDWSLLQPIASRADRMVVESILGRLLSLKIEQFIGTPEDSFARFGFEDTNLELTLEGQRLPGAVQRLRIGAAVPDRPDLVYAKIRNDPSIFTVSTQIVGWVQSPTLSFRNRRLTSLAVPEIRRARVRWGDRVLEFQKDAEAWKMTAPVSVPAENDRVTMLIEAWIGARIEAWIDPPATEAWNEGWDDPMGEILFSRNPEATNALRIAIHRRAPAEGRLLARVDGEISMLELHADLADTLTLDPILFRNLTVLQINPETVQGLTLKMRGREFQAERKGGEWTSPQGAMDPAALAGLLKALSSLRAVSWVRHAPSDPAAFGLDEPWATLTLHRSGEEGFVQTLQIGRDAGLGRYAMIMGRDTVFLLAPDTVQILSAPFSGLNPPDVPTAPAP